MTNHEKASEYADKMTAQKPANGNYFTQSDWDNFYWDCWTNLSSEIKLDEIIPLLHQLNK